MIDIEWQLRLSIRCDTSPRMSDWVKLSIVRLKNKRERRERNATAVKKHGLSLFRDLAGLASAAVTKFNEADELRSLEFESESGPPHSFTVKDRRGASVCVGLDLEREVITYSYADLREHDSDAVREFYLQAGEYGDLIMLHRDKKHQRVEIKPERALQQMLEPVFESVD